MKDKAFLASRILLGLIFFVFGLNGFLQFMPMPEVGEQAGKFMGGLAATGYFFPILKGVEVICGALLLANAFVPLALIILAPIAFQIFLYHTILEPAGAPMAVMIVVFGCATAFSRWDSFAGVLKK